ncbi:MAG TPA: hypothetical protein VIR65_07310 [Rhizorhapis sp.]
MVVTIEPDKVLLSRDFLHRLGRRVGELELSRMKSTDWLATVLYGWDGVILDADGNPFEIDDEMIDFSYGRDASGSWNTEVKKFGQRMPSRRPRKSLKLRLQLWDAAFKIVGKPVME